MWQTYNLNFLLRQANARLVRNQGAYNGTFNMGPTNFIPAIRTYNRFMTNVQHQPEESMEEEQEESK